MPWDNIRRFLAQPRLRLAWVIPFARSAFWTTFFVYPPLYIVKAGGDEMLAAAMLSGGQGLLFLAPVAGRLGSRDRKSVVSGKRVSVRVDLGGRRFIKKKTALNINIVDERLNKE